MPAHHNYQVRLQEFFARRDVRSEWERDYVDVRFWQGGQLFIGEIKVTATGHLRLEEAFRTALGQLLVYGHTKFDEPPGLVMFLDRHLDNSKLLDLANSLSIAVVAEELGHYQLLNPTAIPTLASLFPCAT